MKLKFLLILLFFGFVSSLTILNNVDANTTNNDDVDGTFNTTGYNNPVRVIGFESVGDTSLTPNSTNRFKITLEDLDTMNDIQLLQLRFYFVPSGSAIDTTFNSVDRTTHDGMQAVYEWEHDSRDNPQNGFRLISDTLGESTGSVGSWSADGYVTGSGTGAVYPYPGVTDKDTNTIDSTEFTFELEIQISKVAKFTGTSNDLGAWYMGLYIEDGLVDNNSGISTTTVAALGIDATDPVSASDTAFEMQWYGEVSASGKVDWGDVVPGSNDFNGDGSTLDTASLNGVEFLSNNDYDISINASENWDVPNGSTLPKGVTQASLVADGTLTSPQTFSIKASHNNTYNDADFLDVTDILLHTVSDGTNELGDSFDFTFWLGLSEEFQNTTYTGTITIKVSNNTSQ